MTRLKRVVPSIAGLDAEGLLLLFFVSFEVTAGAMKHDPPPAVTAFDCPVNAIGASPNTRREPAERLAGTISESSLYGDVKPYAAKGLLTRCKPGWGDGTSRAVQADTQAHHATTGGLTHTRTNQSTAVTVGISLPRTQERPVVPRKESHDFNCGWMSSTPLKSGSSSVVSQT